MHQKLFITYTVLIALTFSGALLAGFSSNKAVVSTIVALAMVKFLTVAFQFMELKEAHRFWKILLSLYAVAIGFIFILFL
jgi:hypothetical protein